MFSAETLGRLRRAGFAGGWLGGNAQMLKLPAADERVGREFGRRLRREKAILGVFDEGEEFVGVELATL